MKKFWVLLAILITFAVVWVELRQGGNIEYTENENLVFHPQLDANELKWAETHPVIKVGVLRDVPPYEYVGSDGSIEGIAGSYLRILERSLPLKFVLVPLKNWDVGAEMLKKGQIDAFSFVSADRARDLKLVFSVPYISSSLGIFTNNSGAFINNLDDVLAQKIAVDRHTLNHPLIKNDRRHDYVRFFDTPEALRELSRGGTKFYIGDILNTKFAIEKMGLKNLRYVAPVVGSAYGFGWGADHQNAELIGMINKVLRGMTPEEHLYIRYKWTNIAVLGGSYQSSHYWRYFLWLSGLFALILGGVIYRSRVMRKKVLQQSQSQKMESLGRLAGGVAHDFNNMLAGIQGAAEFMKMNLTAKEQGKFEKYVDIIIKACRRSAHLTSQLLVFSRDKEQNFAPINFNETIKDAVLLLEHGVSKKISIKVDLRAQDCCVYANRNLIQNLLLNLGFNAKDAMPGGGRLEICTENAEITAENVHNFLIKAKRGKYLKLRVADEGCGIAPDILSKIFDPFFTTKEVGKGTGLGLAAVYGIVTDHRGTIRVESSENGTVFEIYFPLSQEKVCQEKEVPPLQKIRAKILAVDDENILLELLKDILKAQKCEVTAFRNPVEAAEYYRHNQDFDVVMLDVLMPELSGVELFGLMSAVNPDLKAVFMSGYSKDNDIEKITSRNPRTRFIKKPYNVEELNQKLAELLKQM